MNHWTLLVTFPPVEEQGVEEQNEGEDFAARVIEAVKKVWEYDDERSNDYLGQGFDDDTLWVLSDGRTQLWFFADIMDAMTVPMDAVAMWTIPLTMVLVQDEAWPDNGQITVNLEV